MTWGDGEEGECVKEEGGGEYAWPGAAPAEAFRKNASQDWREKNRSISNEESSTRKNSRTAEDHLLNLRSL